MRYSKLVGKIKYNSSNKEGNLYNYLIDAGFLAKVDNSKIVFLPLGWRIIDKITKVLKESLEAIEGQEITFPSIVSSDILEKSNRYRFLVQEFISFQDITTGNKMVITHFFEEICAELVKSQVHSIEELPLLLFQFSKKIRMLQDEDSFYINKSEFLGIDVFSVHKNFIDSNNFFPKINSLLTELLEKFSVSSYMIESKLEKSGTNKSIGLAVDSLFGHEHVFYCTKCGYVAQESIASSVIKKSNDKVLSIEKVFTPGVKTVEDLAQYFDVEKHKVAKSTIYRTLKGFIFAVICGDTEISIQKLTRVIDDVIVREASEIELSALSLEINYLSPYKLKDDKFKIIVDEAIVNTNNLIIGANEKGYHYKNANYGVDFKASIVADIAKVRVGDKCLQCQSALKKKSIIELARFVKFPQEFSVKMDLFLPNAKKNPLFLNSYFIGLDRLFIAIVQANFKNNKVLWPEIIAPYKYFLMCSGITLKSKKICDMLYQKLCKDTLYDDREVDCEENNRLFSFLGLPFKIIIKDELSQIGKIELYDSLKLTSEILVVDQFLFNLQP